MASLNDICPPGVITGDDVLNMFEHARANGYAIPAVNCTRYEARRGFASDRDEKGKSVLCLSVAAVVIPRKFFSLCVGWIWLGDMSGWANN